MRRSAVCQAGGTAFVDTVEAGGLGYGIGQCHIARISSPWQAETRTMPRDSRRVLLGPAVILSIQI